jgi:hypothetical protein
MISDRRHTEPPDTPAGRLRIVRACLLAARECVEDELPFIDRALAALADAGRIAQGLSRQPAPPPRRARRDRRKRRPTDADCQLPRSAAAELEELEANQR